MLGVGGLVWGLVWGVIPPSPGTRALRPDDGIGLQRLNRDAGLEGSAAVKVHVPRHAAAAAAAAAVEPNLGPTAADRDVDAGAELGHVGELDQQPGALEVAVVPQQARIVTRLAPGELGAFAEVPRRPGKHVLLAPEHAHTDGFLLIGAGSKTKPEA